MSPIEKSRVKNAPLASAEDKSDFVEWATSIPDGSISAGSKQADRIRPTGGGSERLRPRRCPGSKGLRTLMSPGRLAAKAILSRREDLGFSDRA